jgi:hypothetical protein
MGWRGTTPCPFLFPVPGACPCASSCTQGEEGGYARSRNRPVQYHHARETIPSALGSGCACLRHSGPWNLNRGDRPPQLPPRWHGTLLGDFCWIGDWSFRSGAGCGRVWVVRLDVAKGRGEGLEIEIPRDHARLGRSAGMVWNCVLLDRRPEGRGGSGMFMRYI